MLASGFTGINRIMLNVKEPSCAGNHARRTGRRFRLSRREGSRLFFRGDLSRSYGVPNRDVRSAPPGGTILIASSAKGGCFENKLDIPAGIFSNIQSMGKPASVTPLLLRIQTTLENLFPVDRYPELDASARLVIHLFRHAYAEGEEGAGFDAHFLIVD